MKSTLHAAIAASALMVVISAPDPASAQKRGGTLRTYNPESVASTSMLEEFANAQRPLMGLFNNLVMFDQHVAQDSLRSIVPDLAASWAWNEEGTKLTFQLRQGIKWHDGRPFTAKDVECTWNLLLEKSVEKFRVNPRSSNFKNLDRLTTSGDWEVTFHLRR